MIVIVNILFLLMGIAIVAIGSYGVTQSKKVIAGAQLLQQLDIVLIGVIVTASGVGTILTSIAGLIGAIKKWGNFLKGYALVLFLVCGIQLSMGVYLTTLNTDQLQSTWNEDTDAGRQRRIDYQDHFHCCGWNTLTDSLGYLDTPCPNPGVITLTCKQATINFMHQYVDPLALGSIVVACIELFSMSLACFVIMTMKGPVEDIMDNPFHY